MHTGPQFPPTQPQQPGGPGGRGGALLIGGLAFALVFLLIVGGTIGYLVLRGAGGAGGGEETTASTTTAEETSPEPGPEPTEVEAERCWAPELERTSSNPPGRLRGGGLEFIPPAAFDGRETRWFDAYFNDAQVATAQAEGSWYSTLHVGLVEWQPGIEYPGAQAASQEITDCIFRTNDWGDTTGRTLDDEVTEPVTIAGMPGYRTTATVNFTTTTLTTTDATGLTVVVVDTPEGPSAFIAEIALGVTEHEEGAQAAYDSLTGLSS